MTLPIEKLLFLIFLFFQLQKVNGSHPRPLFSDAKDPLDFTGKDYYDEAQYPDLKSEKNHYIRGSFGGLVTIRPVVKPNIPPDVEPINNLEMVGTLIKVGRIQGKNLWKKKTQDIPVSGAEFVVRTEGMGRTAKGLIIDMSKVQHRGYGVDMQIRDRYYIVRVYSRSPLSGTAKVQFYVNPQWRKGGGKNKRGNKGKKQ